VIGKLYVIGGLTGAQFTPVDTVFAYDPPTNAWTARAPMPTARGALAVGVIGDKIYAVGGSPGARERDAAVYDTTTNTWTVLPPLPTPRNHLTASAIGPILYAVGGRSGGIGGITNVLEAFDPATNAWTTRAAMPTARGGMAGVVADGCLYVFGGEGNAAAPTGIFPHAEVYNPTTNTWQQLAAMPTPRHGIGAAAIGRRIFIPGGATVQGFGVTAVHEAFETTLACQ
jgi:N-acetylneuraminic acid mutarotase